MFYWYEILITLAICWLSFQICVTFLPIVLKGENKGDTYYSKWMVSTLETMFIKITNKKARYIIWGSTFGVSILFFLGVVFFNAQVAIIVALLGLAVGRLVPKYTVKFMRRRRIKKFNIQMIDGLTLLSNALKAGLSIAQGLENVTRQMANPISQELGLVMSEQQVGMTMEEAFINLGKRVPCEDVDMFTTSVIILRETGGNLSETFDTIVNTIRERIKVQQKISALVTQGILQGVVIFLMPFALGITFYIIDPNHIKPMFTSLLGWGLLGFMLVLQLIGGLFMWKIVKIDV